ncbi:hypothetical protein TU77_17575 [Pseudomonas synxantha]|nr:hypothetical protein TU77_17575 [Pseudomonas synxantha]
MGSTHEKGLTQGLRMLNAGCCLELPTQAAPLKPQRRHQEYSVFLTVMRHLFVFICDEIEPVRLVARRSDQGEQTLGLGLLRGYARGVTVKHGALYTARRLQAEPAKRPRQTGRYSLRVGHKLN